MAIRDLQIRLTTVGKIRLGISPQANNSKNPGKLDTLRFTSPAEHLIREIASRYGGECRPWQPQGGGARQFEVISTVDSIPVMVPRQVIDPWYEQWGGGVKQRKCDGVHDQVRNEPCVCNPDARDCRVTTRINVGLSDIQGLGVWLLESHGWNAAAELSGLTGLLQMLPDGVRLPGLLVLEARRVKRVKTIKGEEKVITQDFRVPVIHFDAITMRAINAGGNAILQALGQAAERPALGASTEQDSQAILRDRLYRQISDAHSLRELYDIGKAARAAGIDETTDGVFVARWKAREADLKPSQPGPTPAEQERQTHGTTAAERMEPIEAVIVDEAPAVEYDPDEEYNLILAAAGEHGWNTLDTNDRIMTFTGENAALASGKQLHDFRMAMKAGEIQ